MIFNLTPKVRIALNSLVPNLTDLDPNDSRDLLSSLEMYKKETDVDHEVNVQYAETLIGLLENTYHDALEETPELLVGKPKKVLIDRSYGFYEALNTQLLMEGWRVSRLNGTVVEHG